MLCIASLLTTYLILNDASNVAYCVVVLVMLLHVQLFVCILLIFPTLLVYHMCCVVFFVAYVYFKFRSVPHFTYLLYKILDYGLTVMTSAPVFIFVTLDLDQYSAQNEI